MSQDPARIYLSPPHLGGRERELLMEAFDSNWIAPLGPHVDAFEREFAAAVEMPHAAALSSGTAALHLALRLLDVGPGDEVLCSDLTFAATANAIAYLGARPVFIDADAASWNMDPELLLEELEELERAGRLPKAVVTVDLYGQSADHDPILAACEALGVPVIEDAAEALGASYKGRRGRPVRALRSLLVQRQQDHHHVGRRHARLRRWRCRRARPVPRLAGSRSGASLRALGHRLQLPLVESAGGRRPGAARAPRRPGRGAARGLRPLPTAPGIDPGLEFMPEAAYGQATRWLTCLTIDPELFGRDREAVRLALEAANIEARPVWKPMHLQPVFRDCRVRGGAVGERLFERGLCLPSGSSLTPDDVDRIVRVILER